MPELDLPLIIEADVLEPLLGSKDLLVIDLCKASTYDQYHIPGAVHIEYAQIIASAPPVNGLIPEPAVLEQLFSAVGIGSDTHVVAYDDEGGGKSARLLWTLEIMGHQHLSMLNGGLYAWANDGHKMDAGIVTPQPATFISNYSEEPIANTDYILQNLNNPDIALIDARSEDEFSGRQLMSARGGHIPGAKHWNWQDIMDPLNHQRLKAEGELRQALAERGISPDQQVIAYCQTNHRSSLTYITLKSLGYQHVKGYPGSWSDWGNREETPVEK
ncbi:Thiosulfate sulfurtransferase, rhodanese [hydrothermal vent metagenome]|uniref:Thiosulfate sulfurtransferase, rhodanese n=1 Tax=hydrothermal vent metagenome TaxID=652676 RepID=A0A3B1BEY8_9ZZZZ